LVLWVKILYEGEAIGSTQRSQFGQTHEYRFMASLKSLFRLSENKKVALQMCRFICTNKFRLDLEIS
jgi:hypothetical protein